ncbi:hypothetical protein NDU88_001430 [Pleurodeles waltl]|uniref:Uncharacterized protein n=1 Tax=Pleurodeles waltl TaxID=8319 RepID=A0AAV7TK28_PLEWA|nr:hypothetical protein NDU88_001430 [Pleurodeles waltl]
MLSKISLVRFMVRPTKFNNAPGFLDTSPEVSSRVQLRGQQPKASRSDGHSEASGATTAELASERTASQHESATDLAAAFNTVAHEIRVNCLEAAGLNDMALN